MSIENYKSDGIIIAGAGIASAAMALRLLSLGHNPSVVTLGRQITEGMEAIPEEALPLIAELGLNDAVYQAGGKIVPGFENAWVRAAPVLKSGRWLQIERRAFAAAAIRVALSRGARLSVVKHLPPIPRRCLAAVDATGRSAAWSRPIRRQGNQAADVFEILSTAERGRIERSSDGWIYRIGSTVGVVSPQRRRSAAPAEARFLGRRPAFPQWCEKPIDGHRIAVGDAALAHNPLAGQGIRFALASAFAATSVIQAWADKGDARAACRFYTSFVAQARIRHLEFLHRLELDEAPEIPLPLPPQVRFSGRSGVAELSVDSRIVTGQAILLKGPTAVRWLGGVDLLQVGRLARKPVRSESLLREIEAAGLEPARASAVLSWCLRHGILTSVRATTARQ
jgi:hypothetical protein